MQFGNTARGTDYLQRLTAFMDEHVYPAEATYYAQLKRGELPWNVPPVMEELKAKARAAGLWNLFLPEEEWGAGLSNAEYAPLAEVMGRSLIAPEIFNCNAPDTGNMEVLVKYGTPEQQERWLKPLLQGRIRSAFCMTEPGVASSDATNMQATAVEDGNEVVLNGRKWWSTGIGHPDCQVLVFMGLSLPDAPKHARHSMVLVPNDAPGGKIERQLTVFGTLTMREWVNKDGIKQLSPDIRIDEIELQGGKLEAKPAQTNAKTAQKYKSDFSDMESDIPF